MSVPLGTVQQFYGDENLLPIGYLFCNGTVFSRGQFPALYFHLIAANPALRIDADRCKLPEMRGEFLRGWDNGRNVDTVNVGGVTQSRILGSFQQDEMQKHRHQDRGHSHTHNAAEQTTSVQSDNSDERAAPANPNKANIQTGHADIGDSVNAEDATAGAVRAGAETRPRNVSVAFIIKALPSGEERPTRDVLEALTPEVRELLSMYEDDAGRGKGMK